MLGGVQKNRWEVPDRRRSYDPQKQGRGVGVEKGKVRSGRKWRGNKGETFQDGSTRRKEIKMCSVSRSKKESSLGSHVF